MLDYTIIATTYNDDNKIIEYLDNIMKQNKLPKEIIVVDGGSSDQTVELLKAYKEKYNNLIILSSEERLNISQGYNVAIRTCKTDYIGITGVGNYYPNNFFEGLSNAIVEKNLDLVYSCICGMNATKYSELYNEIFLGGESGKCFSIASNHGVLIKKKIFEQEGYFYEKFIYAGEDTEFYQNILNKGYGIECIKDIKVLWETPQTFKEYCRQEKNYIIANMQIESVLNLLYRYRYSLIIVFLSILSFFSIIAFSLFFLISILLIVKYKSFQCGGVRIINSFITVFYLLIKYKFITKKYKVVR